MPRLVTQGHSRKETEKKHRGGRRAMLDTEQVLCARHDRIHRRHRPVGHRHCPLTPDTGNRVSSARWGCRVLRMPKLGWGRAEELPREREA